MAARFSLIRHLPLVSAAKGSNVAVWLNANGAQIAPEATAARDNAINGCFVATNLF